ncbi:MAG: hypothetical protein K2Y35_20970 [Burkholderiales bacterium]|nr:hypothetical protein [Burkholderiales bacterium]
MGFPHFHRLAAGIVLFVAGIPAALPYDEKAELESHKREAVERVANAHTQELVTGAANLIIKQASIRVARALLAQWGKEASLGPTWKEGGDHWRKAETLLLEETVEPMKNVATGTWVKDIWVDYVGKTFGGEEADVIATHLESSSGQAQVKMMDWFMGETTLFNYTYTGRFQYELKGAEAELKALQKIAVPRIPEKDNEIGFTTKNRDAWQFVACSPQNPTCMGPRYAKLLGGALQGGLIRHIDKVTADIQEKMKGRRADVQPIMEEFRASLEAPATSAPAGER